MDLEQLVEECISMKALIGLEHLTAIRFNTADDREHELDDYFTDEEGYVSRYLDVDGNVIVPYQQIVLSLVRDKQKHVTVSYHTFFHALRKYLLEKGETELSQKVSSEFGLSNDSEYACDQLAIIPSALSELCTEILFAKRKQWHKYRKTADEIEGMINNNFK